MTGKWRKPKGENLNRLRPFGAVFLWYSSDAPCGPFQAWTKPLHPGQAWAQPLRGSGLAHPFHCKTSQPLPVDNCKQLPTAIDCHQFFKNSSFGHPDSQTAEQPPYPPRLWRSRTWGATPPRPPQGCAPCGLPATGPPPPCQLAEDKATRTSPNAHHAF